MFEREWLVTDHFRRMCREIFPVPAAAPEPPRTIRDRVRRFVRGSPVPTAVAPLVTPALAQTRFLMAVCFRHAGLPDEAVVCERFAAERETESDRARRQQIIDTATYTNPITAEESMLASGLFADALELALLIRYTESLPLSIRRLFPERSAAGCDAVRRDHVPGCWVVEAVLRGNEPRQFILPRPPGSG